jgi:predicted AAA+ superfamily ATPase
MQISRKFYFDSIKPYVNKPIIKIITGQRRVGKTMFLEELATLFKDKEVLYISMENKDFSFLKTDDDLNEFLEKEIKE